MHYFCIILLLSCSLSCYGEDIEIQKKDSPNNEELTGFVDPITFDSSNRFEEKDSNKYDDLKKFEESKRYDDPRKYGDSKWNEDSRKDYQVGNYSGAGRQNYFERNDYFDEDYGYIGNPDIFGKIERPCRVYDLNCIRKYFARHSKCKIRRGPLPRTAFRAQLTHYIPFANLSGTLNNVRIGGLRNARIEEFYIDKVTDKMVFSINIRNQTSNIPTTYFQFYRNGREPVVTVTEVFIVFPSITYTAVIPNLNDLRLDKAEIVSFPDTVPLFIPGPEIAFSSDPQVAASLAALLADFTTITQEFLLTDGFFYPTAYIQFNICDFGLVNP